MIDYKDLVKGSYVEDSQYDALLNSKSIETISLGLTELSEQIAELESIRASLKEKLFSLNARIKVLKYKESAIRRRYNAMVQSKVIKIQNRRERKKETDLVSALMSVATGIQLKSKQKRVDEPALRKERIQNNKALVLNRTEQAALACEYALRSGISLDTLPRETVILAGLEHKLSDYEIGGIKVNQLAQNSSGLGSSGVADSTNALNLKDQIITELDENGITVAKFADGTDKFSDARTVNGNSFFDDLIALRDHDLEIRKAELEKGINRIQIDIAQLADTITEEITQIPKEK